MTLDEQTKLINDLIRENPDVTIKEFVELKYELDGIKQSSNGIQQNFEINNRYFGDNWHRDVKILHWKFLM